MFVVRGKSGKVVGKYATRGEAEDLRRPSRPGVGVPRTLPRGAAAP